jgi:broad specificity phosphatase PhoE
MSVLSLVRHGQASYMSMDYDKLSEVGEQQSRKLGDYWARHRIAFDRVVSGPAQRHRRTMEIAGEVARAAGLPWPEPEIVPEFDEFDAFTVMRVTMPLLLEHSERIRVLHEKFESNRHTPEAGRHLQKLFEEAMRLWCTGAFDTPDVESWSQFRSRISRALEGLRETSRPSSSTVVFTSGGPIAASVSHVLALPDDKAIEFVWLSRNTSYSQFLFSGARISLHAFNAIAHLDDLALFTYR